MLGSRRVNFNKKIQIRFKNSPVTAGDRFSGTFRISGRTEGPRAVEVNRGPDLLDPGAVRPLHDLLLDSLGLVDLTVGHGSGLLGLVGGGTFGLLLGGLLGHWLGLGSLRLCGRGGWSLSWTLKHRFEEMLLIRK